MARISTVTFNGSNAYELLVGEFITSWPHGATGFTQAAVGVQLYTATTGAGVRLTLRSFNAAGGLISEQNQSHTISDTSMWERAEKIFSVPDNTDRIELRITALVGTILLAQPKLVNGSVVGTYATNFAPQLTKLSQLGIYTGTLTAKQVIIGGDTALDDALLTLNEDLLSLTRGIGSAEARITQVEAGALKLGTRYQGVQIDQDLGISINALLSGRAVEIKLNKDEGLAYYSDGLFKGGLRLIDGQVSMTSNVVSTDISLKRYATMGSSTFGYGLSIYDKSIQAKPVISVESGLEGGAMLMDEKQNARFHAYPDGTTILRGLNDVERLTLSQDGGAYINNATGANRIALHTDGGTTFSDNSRSRIGIYPNSNGMVMDDNLGRLRFAYDSATSYMRSPNGNVAGVNNTGFYTHGNADIGGRLNGMDLYQYPSGGRGLGMPSGYRMVFEADRINILNRNNQIVQVIQ